jgi:hypothetical protein
MVYRHEGCDADARQAPSRQQRLRSNNRAARRSQDCRYIKAL